MCVCVCGARKSIIALNCIWACFILFAWCEISRIQKAHTQWTINRNKVFKKKSLFSLSQIYRTNRDRMKEKEREKEDIRQFLYWIALSCTIFRVHKCTFVVSPHTWNIWLDSWWCDSVLLFISSEFCYFVRLLLLLLNSFFFLLFLFLLFFNFSWSRLAWLFDRRLPTLFYPECLIFYL